MSKNMRMPDREWSKNMWARIVALIDSVGQAADSAGQAAASAIKAISFNGGNVPPDATGRVTLAESDPTVPAWAKQATKPTYTAQEVGALPSNTAIPSKTSDLTNDGNGTSPFATLADLPEGNNALFLSNDDISDTNDLKQALLTIPNGQGCPFFADTVPASMMTRAAAEVNGHFMSGVINVFAVPGGSRNYYFIGMVTGYAGDPDILVFASIAFSPSVPPVVLGTPYYVSGTPATL